MTKESPVQTANRLQIIFKGQADQAYTYAKDQARAASQGKNMKAVIHYHRVANVLIERF